MAGIFGNEQENHLITHTQRHQDQVRTALRNNGLNEDQISHIESTCDLDLLTKDQAQKITASTFAGYFADYGGTQPSHCRKAFYFDYRPYEQDMEWAFEKAYRMLTDEALHNVGVTVLRVVQGLPEWFDRSEYNNAMTPSQVKLSKAKQGPIWRGVLRDKVSTQVASLHAKSKQAPNIDDHRMIARKAEHLSAWRRYACGAVSAAPKLWL